MQVRVRVDYFLGFIRVLPSSLKGGVEFCDGGYGTRSCQKLREWDFAKGLDRGLDVWDSGHGNIVRLLLEILRKSQKCSKPPRHET